VPPEGIAFFRISVSVRLIIVWLACMAGVTLAPFDFGGAAGELLQYRPLQRPGGPFDFALNLVLFIPFGVLAHHEGQRRSLKLLPLTVIVAAVAFVLSATVECAQVFLPSRFSSLTDVFANIVGALIGAGAGHAWGEPAVSFANSLRTRTSSKRLTGISAAWAAIALVCSGALQTRTQLSNWRGEYPLLIGNEETGDRPWRGQVLMVTLVDSPTAVATVRRFADGGDIVLPGTTIAAFDLTTGAPYTDGAGNVPELRAVHRAGASWLRSDGPAAILARRLRASNAFSIRVRVASDDPNPHDVARIVSNSVSPFRRNFTLGQLGDDLIIRLRTPVTGDNGVRFQMGVPDVFTTKEVRDILVTYDGATLLAAAHGGHSVSRIALGPGSAVAASIARDEIITDQIPLFDIAYFGALFLPPAVLIGVLGHSRRDQIRLAVGYLLAFTVLFEITLTLIGGRPFDSKNIGATGAIGALVLLVVIGAVSAPGGRSQATETSWFPRFLRVRT
jgi:VanZ family protein